MMFELRKNRWVTITRLVKSGISPPIEYLLNCSSEDYEEFVIAFNTLGGR